MPNVNRQQGHLYIITTILLETSHNGYCTKHSVQKKNVEEDVEEAGCLIWSILLYLLERFSETEIRMKDREKNREKERSLPIGLYTKKLDVYLGV